MYHGADENVRNFFATETETVRLLEVFS
jgi:hypothetical protein